MTPLATLLHLLLAVMLTGVVPVLIYALTLKKP